MEQEMALQCRCGRVRGLAQVSPQSVTHLVCYCDDCQAFARHLQREDVLDAAGGTGLCHLPPACMRISEGQQELRSLRLSKKGMYRWYADCCKTPLANSMDGRAPFVGLIVAFMDPAQAGRREELLGPPTGIMAKFATGPLPPNAHDKPPPRLLLRILGHMLGSWIRGKGRPHPFFTAQNLPVAMPQVLSAAERDALRRGVSGAEPRATG